MRRKVVLLLIIVGVIGIIVGSILLFRARSPQIGVLKINTTPPATIFLDNKTIGRTPYEDKIAAGEYTIKLVPESTTQTAASWQGSVKVATNLLTYINADLGESDFHSSVDVLWLEKITSNQSELSVVTNPDGATVTLDGESKGITPLTLTGISSGDHTVVVSSVGFVSRSIKIRTTPGYKLIATMKLALSALPAVTPTPTQEATASASLSPTPSGKTAKTQPTGSPTPTPPKKPYVTIEDTPTGFLRVRFEPTTNASETARVKPGEQFGLLETDKGWYKIQLDPKTTGWISAQYATKTE